MVSFRHTAAALGALVVAVLVSGAGAAAAAGGLEPGDPPPPVRLPNLVMSAASVVPLGTAQWQIRYTVSNRGTAPASAFHVAVQQNGTSLIKDTAYGPLSPGASRSEEILITRSSCYVPVRFLADPTHVVLEAPRYDNERWAVGLESSTCPTQPKYMIKASSFHAVDESGTDWLGSDEPYWVFGALALDGRRHAKFSRVFGDIDSGDTAFFNSSEGCLYLSCDGCALLACGGAAPDGISFSVQLWEHDVGQIPLVIGTDDLIEAQLYAYDPAYLAAKLPAVGGRFDDVRTYSDGDAVYTLTVAATRVA
jgi:hypothetical protein